MDTPIEHLEEHGKLEWKLIGGKTAVVSLGRVDVRLDDDGHLIASCVHGGVMFEGRIVGGRVPEPALVGPLAPPELN